MKSFSEILREIRVLYSTGAYEKIEVSNLEELNLAMTIFPERAREAFVLAAETKSIYPFQELNSKELNKLRLIDARLALVVVTCAALGPNKLTVLEGIRSLKRQKELFAEKKTWTMTSNHLTGNAVDIAPLPISWEWGDFYPIADQMDAAADLWEIPLTWGSAWDQTTEQWDDSLTAQKHYKQIRRAQGRKATLDGPHWEIPASYQKGNKEAKDAIRGLQHKYNHINSLGVQILADGFYGDKTDAAVRELVNLMIDDPAKTLNRL